MRVFFYKKWKQYLNKGRQPEVLQEMINEKNRVFESYRKDDMEWLEAEWAKISNNIGISLPI